MSRRTKCFSLLLVLVVLGLGLARLRLDVDVLNLLPQDLPAVQGLKLHQQHFSAARELIITLRSDDADAAEAAARSLAGALRRAPALARQVTWQPPWLEHPGQSAELLAYLWLNQPPDAFRALADRLGTDRLPALLQAAREQLATSLSPADLAQSSYDPLGFTRLPATLRHAAMSSATAWDQGNEYFASADGQFRMIFVEADADVANYRQAAAWLDRTRAVVASWSGTYAGKMPVIRFTGGPAFVAEISENMQREIRWSVGGTALFIAGIFWLAHRRLKPMLWLLALLAAILLGTLALGGLIFPSINVVSVGFAAILLGLAVDYGVVHYQEALAQPALSVPQVRRRIGPGIFWAAVTTISAFLVLNFSGLPGLALLGSLVAVGVGLSALTMIFFFLPPLFPERMRTNPSLLPVRPDTPPPADADRGLRTSAPVPAAMSAWLATGLLAIGVVITLWSGIPRMDSTAGPLRPQGIPAYAAMDEIKQHLNSRREPFWLIVAAEDESQMGGRLDRVDALLARARTNQIVGEYLLPTQLWPRPQNQQPNRKTAAALVARRDEFRSALRAGGFSEAAFGLAGGVLDAWERATTTTGLFWPTNDASQWLFDKVIARAGSNRFVAGFVYPPANQPAWAAGSLRQLEPELAGAQASLSGWELLGPSVFERVRSRIWLVLLPMVALVLLSLGLAFRRATEILLGLAALSLGVALLLAVMKLAGWDWNLMNLMALPLVLGTGVDYGIFMQLALRRHGGDLREAHRAVGRALLLCGATAAAGFGSLAWSSNAGMASLGRVCAVGITGNMLIAVYLLPRWWKGLARPAAAATSAPSSLYSTALWRLALALTRRLPEGGLRALAQILATAYWTLARHRREVIIQNLLPLVAGDRARAETQGRRLLANFSRKLVDLWRYENGQPIGRLTGDIVHWERLEQARAQQRGVLIVTPHLGNWEFGAPLLSGRGVKLLVITLVEPSRGLTELRQASRARLGVETLVIGDDPFAVVEIIRRLEAGAVVALLMDRPAANSAVTVELLGRPFQASIAAAELARASGCVLLPACLLHDGDGYRPEFLAPVEYDRPALRDREARRQLTQQIMRAFEPVIRQHPDQWYHFVPVWPGK